jgi:hypothetical protein
MERVVSKRGVPIRLPLERWVHITEEHAEMAGLLNEVLATVEDPAAVFSGNDGECLAVRELEAGKYIVAVYREVSGDDGFVITAFLTSRLRPLERRHRQWPP